MTASPSRRAIRPIPRQAAWPRAAAGAARRAFAAALIVALGTGASSAQEIGRAGAVNPAAQGTRPGAGARTLELGSNVVFKERITTAAAGSVQLLFVDKTTLSVGPNSNLVIDEFVYDPGTGRGRTAISLARGALRFVGGNTSHTDGATITTPVATMGIRGGVATVRYDDRTKEFKATNVFGVMTISTATGTETIRRPGFSVTVAGSVPGAAPAAPVRVTLAEVNGERAALTSQPGQTGGAREQPTDTGSSQRGVAAVNIGTSPATPGVQRQAVATASSPNQTTTANTVAQVSSNSLGSPLIVNAASRRTDALVATQVAARTEATDAPAAPVPVPVTPAQSLPAPNVPAEPPQAAAPAPAPEPAPAPTPTPVPPPPPGARAFALTTQPDPALNSTVPFVLGAAVATGQVNITPIYGYRAASTDGVNPGPTRTLQVAFGINGSGTGANAVQSSNFLVATTSRTTLADGSEALNGGFVFSGRRAANLTMSRANGSIATVPGTYIAAADTTPVSSGVNQDFIGGGNTIQSDTAFERPGGGGTGQNYTYRQEFRAAATPSGLGASRQTGSFSGFAAGMVRTLDNVTNNNIAEFAQPVIGGAVLFTDATTSRVQLNMALNAVTTTGRPAGALHSANLQLGSIQGSLARGTYIDDATFGAREAATAVSPGGQTPVSTVNGQALTNDHAAMASSATTNIQSFNTNVTFCACEYIRWGFWSDETARPGYSDRVHLGTWIVGPASTAVDLPTTGIATYTGHAIAAMRTAGNEYVAASNMTNAVNFATRSIAASIPSLDGRAYTGTLSIPTNSAATVGTLTGTGGVSMSVMGQFYGSVAGAAPRELGGALTINGGANVPNYGGAGIFATRR